MASNYFAADYSVMFVHFRHLLTWIRNLQSIALALILIAFILFLLGCTQILPHLLQSTSEVLHSSESNDNVAQFQRLSVSQAGPQAQERPPLQFGLVDPSTQSLLRKIAAEDLEDGPPKTIVQGFPPELKFVERRQLTIPARIPCRLVITKAELDGESTIRHENLFSMPWLDPKAFDRCRRTAEVAILKKLDPGYKFYGNTQNYRIMKVSADPDPRTWEGRRKLQRQKRGEDQSLGEVEVHIGSIDKAQEWGEQLQAQLAYHLSTDRTSVFLLEVTLSFTTIRPHDIRSCDTKNCIDEQVWKDLRERQISIDQKRFIPGRYLDQYFSPELIEHLVDKNEILRKYLKTIEERKELVEWIHLFAVRLLASCILAGVSIGCLYGFWKDDKGDSDFPELLKMHPTTLSRLENWFLSVKAHEFKTSNRKSENPLDVVLEAQHEQILPNIILPIVKREPLASTGSARVDRVKIHEDHHQFSANKHEWFALKVIIRDPNLWKGRVSKETDVLKRLAKVPHPHLTPMLGSWSQDTACAILMPLAEQDLDDFVTKVEAPAEFDHTFLTWLLTQITGIADGLKFFHYHVGGLHHDLRLKNILVFAGDVLKISDFGTAQINALAQSGDDRNQSYSHHTRNQLSDAGYHAPDLEKYGVVSRPQDVWSLGCIILEIIVWASGRNVQEFRQQRINFPTKVNGYRSTGFWYQSFVDGSPVFSLKPCVKEMIARIRNDSRLTDTSVLKTLLGIIEGMVRIDAYEVIEGASKDVQVRTGGSYRLDMKNVVDRLGKILAEARLDLKKQPSTGTIDDVSQARTVVKVPNPTHIKIPKQMHMRRHSTGDIPVSLLMPNDGFLSQRPSTPNARLETAQLGAHLSNENNSPTSDLPTIVVSPVEEQQPTGTQLFQVAEREHSPPREYNEFEDSYEGEGSSSGASTSGRRRLGGTRSVFG